jgi:hypothetical protein
MGHGRLPNVLALADESEYAEGRCKYCDHRVPLLYEWNPANSALSRCHERPGNGIALYTRSDKNVAVAVARWCHCGEYVALRREACDGGGYVSERRGGDTGP